MKILLAEDDARLRKNIGYILNKDFHHVVEVNNGQDALDNAIAEWYDLLILDWMMPSLSGIEVCQQLRNAGFSGGILMLTAKDDTADVIQGLDSGADDYLVKPFKMEELLPELICITKKREGNRANHRSRTATAPYRFPFCHAQ